MRACLLLKHTFNPWSPKRACFTRIPDLYSHAHLSYIYICVCFPHLRTTYSSRHKDFDTQAHTTHNTQHTLSGTETPSRTSQGTFFTGDAAKHPLIESVEERMEWVMNHPALVTGKSRLGRTEALQVCVAFFYKVRVG